MTIFKISKVDFICIVQPRTKWIEGNGQKILEVYMREIKSNGSRIIQSERPVRLQTEPTCLLCQNPFSHSVMYTTARCLALYKSQRI